MSKTGRTHCTRKTLNTFKSFKNCTSLLRRHSWCHTAYSRQCLRGTTFGARQHSRGCADAELRHSSDTYKVRSATPSRLIGVPTSAIPTIFMQDALPYTTQFILAWDRHQICWLAYPVAWFHTRNQCL